MPRRNPYLYPAGQNHILEHRPVGLKSHGSTPAAIYYHDMLKADAWDEATEAALAAVLPLMHDPLTPPDNAEIIEAVRGAD